MSLSVFPFLIKLNLKSELTSRDEISPDFKNCFIFSGPEKGRLTKLFHSDIWGSSLSIFVFWSSLHTLHFLHFRAILCLWFGATLVLLNLYKSGDRWLSRQLIRLELRISTANQNAALFTHSNQSLSIALRKSSMVFHGFIGVAGQRERHSTNLHDIWDMLKAIDFEFFFKNRKFPMLTRYNTFCIITRKLFYKQAPKKILRYNIGGFRTS